MQARKGRLEESRGLDIRDIDSFQNVLNMKAVSPFYFHPSIVPHGMEYAWKRVEYAGITDYNNFSEALRMRWKPVPAERHPDLTFGSYQKEDSPWKQYIYRLGQVLMERETEYCQLERKSYQDKSQRQITSIPASEALTGTPSMPMVVYQNQTALNGVAPFEFSE